VDSADGALEQDVLERIFRQNDIPVLNLPAGVTVEWRDGLYIGLNYSSRQQELPIADGQKILIGDKKLSPAGVAVWK
jgi:beta-galactosidase